VTDVRPSSIKEFRTKLEVEAAQMREGLIAFEQGYDLPNVMSLSRIAQKTYWKLREDLR
jgi:hypothetical protein